MQQLGRMISSRKNRMAGQTEVFLWVRFILFLGRGVRKRSTLYNAYKDMKHEQFLKTVIFRFV